MSRCVFHSQPAAPLSYEPLMPTFFRLVTHSLLMRDKPKDCTRRRLLSNLLMKARLAYGCIIQQPGETVPTILMSHVG